MYPIFIVSLFTEDSWLIKQTFLFFSLSFSLYITRGIYNTGVHLKSMSSLGKGGGGLDSETIVHWF